jgi:hypothetical protein
MKNLTLVAALLVVVAVGSYSLGRRHGSPAASADTDIAEGNRGKAGPPSREPFSPVQVTIQKTTSSFNLPFSQNLTAAQRGFEAARLDIDEALKQIDGLPVPERMGFVHGIFSFVARNHPPAEAMKIFQKVPEAHRPNALRGLVAEWIDARSPLDADAKYLKREGTLTISGGSQGLEVELSRMLASAKPDAELMAAWLENFSGHSARSEIFAMFAVQAGERAETFFGRMDKWTDWEKIGRKTVRAGIFWRAGRPINRRRHGIGSRRRNRG